MTKSHQETFCPSSRADWRRWLEENHDKQKSVWIICYKKETGIPTVEWSEAVDEALCFGWIDSTRRTLDKERFTQYFCRRKPKSTWSKINKAKVEQLTAEGRMAPAGLETVRIAKDNGYWSILDDVEDMIIPPDLQKELNTRPGAPEFFRDLRPSVIKSMLARIALARLPATRRKHILEIAEHAGRNQVPERYGG